MTIADRRKVKKVLTFSTVRKVIKFMQIRKRGNFMTLRMRSVEYEPGFTLNFDGNYRKLQFSMDFSS